MKKILITVLFLFVALIGFATFNQTNAIFDLGDGGDGGGGGGTTTNHAPSIILTSNSDIHIGTGDAKRYHGCTAHDQEDGTLSCTITDSINVNVPGTYPIYYKATDSGGKTTLKITYVIVHQRYNAREINVTYDRDYDTAMAHTAETMYFYKTKEYMIEDYFVIGDDFISNHPCPTGFTQIPYGAAYFCEATQNGYVQVDYTIHFENLGFDFQNYSEFEDPSMDPYHEDFNLFYFYRTSDITARLYDNEVMTLYVNAWFDGTVIDGTGGGLPSSPDEYPFFEHVTSKNDWYDLQDDYLGIAQSYSTYDMSIHNNCEVIGDHYDYDKQIARIGRLGSSNDDDSNLNTTTYRCTLNAYTEYESIYLVVDQYGDLVTDPATRGMIVAKNNTYLNDDIWFDSYVLYPYLMWGKSVDDDTTLLERFALLKHSEKYTNENELYEYRGVDLFRYFLCKEAGFTSSEIDLLQNNTYESIDDHDNNYYDLNDYSDEDVITIMKMYQNLGELWVVTQNSLD